MIIYIKVYISLYVYIYIYIIEREREIAPPRPADFSRLRGHRRRRQRQRRRRRTLACSARHLRPGGVPPAARWPPRALQFVVGRPRAPTRPLCPPSLGAARTGRSFSQQDACSPAPFTCTGAYYFDHSCTKGFGARVARAGAGN